MEEQEVVEKIVDVIKKHHGGKSAWVHRKELIDDIIKEFKNKGVIKNPFEVFFKEGLELMNSKYREGLGK